MKKKLFFTGALIFIFTFVSLPLAGITPGTAQAQVLQVDRHPCIISNIAAVNVDRTDIPVDNRIFVSCSNSTATGLSSFASAIGTTATTAGNANRYLVVLNTALALGKTVTVIYDLNPNHNPLGCQPDCRNITGLVLGP